MTEQPVPHGDGRERLTLGIGELARLATRIENGETFSAETEGSGLIVGITGPPGAGKSSLVDALTAELRARGKTIAIIAVDPSSRSTGGAILGDRVRMQRHYADPGVFIRSMATRGAMGGLARTSAALSRLFRSAGFDFVLIETVGVGQDEIDVAALADVTAVVLVSGMGDDIQAIKAGLMEIADIFVINKAERAGVEQTQRQIENMLSLGPNANGNSAALPPILRTIAVEGTGVAELADELEKWGRRYRPEQPLQWSIDHIGVAVKSLDDALPFYEAQLGVPAAARETVAGERVNVAMLPAGEARIELLEPADADSTVAKFLAKRGPGLHHVAMRIPDLNETARRLEKAGVRLLGKPQQGAGGHLYVFVHPDSAGGVLWELIQK
ncbi:MAG: methylmalonyl Co-A mutase-associated GTPase MeaB [Acidobacteriota bacterium]|nr:methylmalonyl Co-A mutase-associated GTPase MeaB [Acidobacteriota bacterium]